MTQRLREREEEGGGDGRRTQAMESDSGAAGGFAGQEDVERGGAAHGFHKGPLCWDISARPALLIGL